MIQKRSRRKKRERKKNPESKDLKKKSTSTCFTRDSPGGGGYRIGREVPGPRRKDGKITHEPKDPFRIRTWEERDSKKKKKTGERGKGKKGKREMILKVSHKKKKESGLKKIWTFRPTCGESQREENKEQQIGSPERENTR